MKKKIFLTLLLTLIFSITICTYSFAATQAGNIVKNTGNSIGGAISGAAGAVMDGARDLTNGASNIMGDMSNAEGDVESDATNTMDNNNGMFGGTNDNYIATRTSTGNNNLMGMSDTTWTWLILGAVGLAIVGLVWYYGAQYEHRSYNND